MEAGVKERTLDIVRVVMGKPLREEASPDGTTQLIAGDPGKVVVTVSKERVSVFEYAIVLAGTRHSGQETRSVGRHSSGRVIRDGPKTAALRIGQGDQEATAATVP